MKKLVFLLVAATILLSGCTNDSDTNNAIGAGAGVILLYIVLLAVGFWLFWLLGKSIASGMSKETGLIAGIILCFLLLPTGIAILVYTQNKEAEPLNANSSASSTGSNTNLDLTTQLKTLNELRTKGVITEEMYEQESKKILEKI